LGARVREQGPAGTRITPRVQGQGESLKTEREAQAKAEQARYREGALASGHAHATGRNAHKAEQTCIHQGEACMRTNMQESMHCSCYVHAGKLLRPFP
jgi:hypothetical protein